jgi:hypothetical protein
VSGGGRGDVFHTFRLKGRTAMMLAYRLVRLIEAHSDQLATELLDKLQRDPRTQEYKKVPGEEFKQAVFEVYRKLGEWLLGKTEADIEDRYTTIGKRRAQQGVTLSELIYAITLTKEHLLEFLKNESVADKPVEVFGELEVLYLLGQFFDRANYYAAIGFESYRPAKAATK